MKTTNGIMAAMYDVVLKYARAAARSYPRTSYFRPPVLFALLLVLTATFACGPSRSDVNVDAAIGRMVEERVALFKKRQLEDCYQRALTEASRRADSVLIVRARLERDFGARPPRPTRPGELPQRELQEPLPLKPLFPDSILPPRRDTGNGR